MPCSAHGSARGSRRRTGGLAATLGMPRPQSGRAVLRSGRTILRSGRTILRSGRTILRSGRTILGLFKGPCCPALAPVGARRSPPTPRGPPARIDHDRRCHPHHSTLNECAPEAWRGSRPGPIRVQAVRLFRCCSIRHCRTGAYRRKVNLKAGDCNRSSTQNSDPQST